jgi:phospholipid transport system substrate-binding protein
MRNIITVAILLFATAGTELFAMPQHGYMQPDQRTAQTQEAGPGQILRQGMTKLLKFMRQEQGPSQQQIAMFVEREIAPYFDFEYMTQWVAGPMNRYMSDQERAEMVNSVKTMLLGTLTQRLTSYDNQDVRFYRPRRAGKNEVKVRIGILQAGGYPANVDFRFYRGAEGWKVFDVSANGSSALTYYRQHFSRQFRQRTQQGGYRR